MVARGRGGEGMKGSLGRTDGNCYTEVDERPGQGFHSDPGINHNGKDREKESVCI